MEEVASPAEQALPVSSNTRRTASPLTPHTVKGTTMSSSPATSRRSFLAGGAALAAIPAVATLTGGAFADPAFADHAPIPPSALGPALNEQGYFVGRVEKNLYWVTDGSYQAAFLTTREGVVLFDAPPSIGANLQRAIDQIASANGVSNKVTHIVYSHHHADHLGASSLFGRDVVRVGHVETKRLLARDNDAARPVPLPDLTFETHRTLHVGGERIDLAWHGTNHTPDNIYIHFPDHDTLMLVDVILPGWVPYDSFNLNEDVPGSLAAPDTAMAYPWTHFIGGHMGRLGTRDDLAVYQQYVTDLIDNIKIALGAVKTFQDAQVAYATAPVIQKYLGILAAADVYTPSTAFHILESIRLDLGFGSQVHP